LWALYRLYPSREKWLNNVLPSICAIVEEYEQALNFNHIGFPENWDKLLSAPRLLLRRTAT